MKNAPQKTDMNIETRTKINTVPIVQCRLLRFCLHFGINLDDKI